jgi:glycosyltransferase involved in cell wall biosynthesis
MSTDTVFIIEAGLGLGGGQRAFLELVSAFTKLNYSITVLVSNTSLVHQALEDRRVNVKTIPALTRSSHLFSRLARTLQYLRYLWMNRALISSNRFVIVNDPDFFIPSVLIAKYLRAENIILYAHLIYSPFQNRIFGYLANSKSVKAVFCASNFLKEHVSTQKVNKQSKYHLLRPPCRFQLHEPPKISREWTLASVGLLHPMKGHEVLLQVACLYPDKKFYVVGPEHKDFHEYAQKLRKSAPRNVCFTGYQQDIAAFFNENKIQGLIIASRNDFESFGLVALEAVALGRVAIARKTGGLREIIEELLIPGGDSDSDLVELAVQQIESMRLSEVLPAMQSRLHHGFGREKFLSSLANILSS